MVSGKFFFAAPVYFTTPPTSPSASKACSQKNLKREANCVKLGGGEVALIEQSEAIAQPQEAG